MVNVETLALQIDSAMDGLVSKRKWWQILSPTVEEHLLAHLNNPNSSKAANHLDTLLCYPEAAEAIRLIREENKNSLRFYISGTPGKPELSHILDSLSE